MRVLFVGGSTGGHLTPGLALAEAIETAGGSCLFVTAGRAVEDRFFADGRPRTIHGLDAPFGFRLPRLLLACRRTRQAARTFQPDLVVSLGGLAGLPALAVGFRAPFVAIEGNAVAGRAVRLLSRRARGVLCLFEPAARTLGRKGHFVGPLLRAEPHRERGVVLTERGLDPDGTTLLALGGSQGASAIDAILVGMAASLAEAGIQVLAQAREPDRVRTALDAAGVRCCVADHFDRLGELYRAADLGLCRGGGGTISELWAAALPAVILPYPGHKDRQQFHNAATLGDGLAVSTADAAPNQLMDLLTNPSRRSAMADSLRSTCPADGLRRAIDLLLVWKG